MNHYTIVILLVKKNISYLQNHEILQLQNSSPNSLDLIRFESQTYSQNGEDGIISEICKRLHISTGSFLEIGVQDGRETNTNLLLVKGWHGNWIECDKSACNFIRNTFAQEIELNRLILKESFVNANSIKSILDDDHKTLVSIDIDRNTYHICKSVIEKTTPIIVVVEYNASFPPDVEWICEYRENGVWDGSMVMGASLNAYEKLFNEMGYKLVSCDLSGTNVFFVRSDYLKDEIFPGPFTTERHYQPIRYHLSGRRGYAHPLKFRD